MKEELVEKNRDETRWINNKIKNSACYKSRALQPFEAMSANKEEDGQEVYKKELSYKTSVLMPEKVFLF